MREGSPCRSTSSEQGGATQGNERFSGAGEAFRVLAHPVLSTDSGEGALHDTSPGNDIESRRRAAVRSSLWGVVLQLPPQRRDDVEREGGAICRPLSDRPSVVLAGPDPLQARKGCSYCLKHEAIMDDHGRSWTITEVGRVRPPQRAGGLRC